MPIAMPCTLHIQGFLGCYESAGRPRLPILERILARAVRLKGGDLSGALVGLEGLSIAPFTYLADTGKADGEFRLRADPVHLAADRDQLVLMPGSLLDVTPEEAQALAAAFNGLNGGEGWRLEWPLPERAYLRCPQVLRVETHAPETVAGQPVLEFMPHGEDAATLKQLMNETQMLFHEHPVNRAREEEGRPLINSLWFWGGGTLTLPVAKAPAGAAAELSLVRGFAIWTGAERFPRPGSAELKTMAEGVVTLEARDLESLDAGWFASLYAALRAEHLTELRLHLESVGSFKLGSRDARRFWRRRRPMAGYLP
ncbi:MAG TPA: hypothetical protein VLG68_03615 [Gammaproteobacteria bacterium]|nr:hypothetical protein [Gammaproteobacteria bacterium]